MDVGYQQKQAEPAGFEGDKTLDWSVVPHGVQQQFF
jgi:hypothetical protein